MQVTSNGRVRRSPAEWRKLVSRFQGSEQSCREFCRKEKVNVASFQRWQKRLAQSRQLPEFVEVAPVRDNSSSWAVEVELTDGTVLRLRG